MARTLSELEAREEFGLPTWAAMMDCRIKAFGCFDGGLRANTIGWTLEPRRQTRSLSKHITHSH